MVGEDMIKELDKSFTEKLANLSDSVEIDELRTSYLNCLTFIKANIDKQDLIS